MTSTRDLCCKERLSEIRATVELLASLAEHGEGVCERDECLVVYATVRDAAWKIRTALSAHGGSTQAASAAENAQPASKSEEKERASCHHR